MLFVTPKNNMSVMYRSYFHSATVFQYGHWMITFIRENVRLNVLNILIHATRNTHLVKWDRFLYKTSWCWSSAGSQESDVSAVQL